MKEEMTREVLEAMKRCSETSCSGCLARGVCISYDSISIRQRFATALLEERARPKVWDGAPDNATVAVVDFKRTCGDLLEPLSFEAYTRELPKTREPPKSRARQIAENLVHGITGVTNNETKDIEYVEGVLKRYAEELEGKE